MDFKEIPQSWLVAFLGVCLVCMRFMGIDSWTTASLGSLMGYFLGRHIVQSVNSSTDIPIIQSSAVVEAPSAPIAA